MTPDDVGGLVARFLTDADRRSGGSVEPSLLYRHVVDAVWNWWRDTPGVTVGTARQALHEAQVELSRRQPTRLLLER